MIKKSTYGQSEHLKKAFLHHESAVAYADEWSSHDSDIGFEPIEAQGELIDGDRVIVYSSVYDLDDRGPNFCKLEIILSKLHQEDVEVLRLFGLKDSP